MNVNETVRYCKGLDFYALQDFAGKNFNKVYNHVEKTKTKPNDILIPTIFTCIATDGKLSEREWNFIASFIGGYSYDEALSVAGEFYCDEAKEIVKKLYCFFTQEVKEAFLSLCIAVLAVDNRLDGAEIDFLNYMIN